MPKISRLLDFVLFLDVDGTLLEFALKPSEVVVPRELLACLMRLRLQLDNALAFVSGRMLASVDNLFYPLMLPGAYSHGGEIRYPDHVIATNFPSSEDMVKVLREAELWCASKGGIYLEKKSNSLALHFRGTPYFAQDVLCFAEYLQSRLGPDFMVLHGHAVVEVKSATINKGTALETLLQYPNWRKKKPIFIGDDVTDEDGFAVVNAVGGISVKVGAGSTCATSSLKNPVAVRNWLNLLTAQA